MALRFLICELVSGKVLDELPMTIEGDLTRLLQAYGEGTLGLPLRNSEGELVSATWEQDIQPWRSLIIVVDEHDRILWHGIPTKRGRGTASKVRYPCRTVEAYLIERYVTDMTFIQADQTSVIFRALMEVAGAGINLEYDCPPSGVLRDHEYRSDDNARVYDRVNELSLVLDGFNWTIDVVWGDPGMTYVRKIARTGYPHLGNRDENPAHFFELGQNVTDFAHEDEEGPTAVSAYGDVPETPEGEEAPENPTRVFAGPVIDLHREAAGWPRREARQAFSGVTDQDTITRHAFGLAAYLFGGQEMVELEARNPGPGEDFTRLGDFTLGDTARALIKCDSLTLDAVWPVVGWALTPSTGVYKPTLAKLGEYRAE